MAHIQPHKSPAQTELPGIPTELLLDAWDGIKRRFGIKIEDLSMNEQNLHSLIEAKLSAVKADDKHFLTTAVMVIISELKSRLADGSITLPTTNNMGKEEEHTK